MDVADRVDKGVQTLVRVGQECSPRNDELPFAVPDRTANQPLVGILSWLQRAVGSVNAGGEGRRGRYRAEGLLFTYREQWLGQRVRRCVKRRGRKVRGPDVEGQRDGHVIHIPGANCAGVPQRRAAHGIRADGNQINVRRGGKRGGTQWAIGRGDPNRIVHPLIAVKADAYREDFSGKRAGAESVIARAQGLAEKVLPVGDGGAEGQLNAGHGLAAAVVNLQAVVPHIRIRQQVRHHVLLQ